MSHKRNTRKNFNQGKERKMSKEEHEHMTNGQAIVRKKKLVTILPPITATPIVAYTRRYITSQSATTSISIAQLFDSGLFAVNTILAYPLYRALRIRKIRMLAPVTTQGTSVTLAMTPVSVDSANNNFVSLPQTYVDTSASIDKPAYICLKPSVETPLGSWHLSNTTTNNILTLQYPAGTTMDIFFEGILNITTAPLGYSTAISAGATGTLYARAMATNFIPQGINII